MIIATGKEGYRLFETWLYTWLAADGIYRRLRVPEGFESDGASVPRLLWWLVPRDGLHRAAALAHDFLIRRNGVVGPNCYAEWDPEAREWIGLRRIYTEKEADRLFLRIQREAGTPRWRRRLAWRAVRVWSILSQRTWGHYQ